jgi:hypothetical protein
MGLRRIIGPHVAQGGENEDDSELAGKKHQAVTSHSLHGPTKGHILYLKQTR